jgi:hypothetical protein
MKRVLPLGVGLLLLSAAGLQAQKSRTATGSSVAASVKGASGVQQLAVAQLPTGGGQASNDTAGVSMSGQLTSSSISAVTAGEADSDGLGSTQSVATASDVNLLNGVVTADRVVGIASVVMNRNKFSGDVDGSSITNLSVNGTLVAGGDYTPAPNTRMTIPGGYVVLNEQAVNGKGSGMSVSVNMIHVYLSSGGEIVVGAANSAIQ